MTKYLLYTGLAVSAAQAVFALQITEIMYDPAGSDSGYEWIEIYNDTGASINVTSLKLLEGGVKHGISVGIGGSALESNEYAIISSVPANFMSAHSGYAGKVFDSVFSLSNTGESFSFIDSAGNTLASATYLQTSNTSETGGSLNLEDGAWTGYAESPGLETSKVTVLAKATSTSQTTSSQSSNSSSTYVVINKGYVSMGKGAYTLGEMSLLTAKDVYGMVGGDTYFMVMSADSSKSIIPSNTFWSFGDGAEGRGATTTHKYFNPGRYTAFVESEVSGGYGIDSINVTIVMPDLAITKVEDNYIMLKNNSTSTDLNIGGFYIGSDQGYFRLSRHLLIKASEEIKLDGRVLGFTKLTNPKILTSSMTLVTKYIENKNEIISDKTQNATTTAKATTTKISSKIKKIKIVSKVNEKKIISMSSTTTKPISIAASTSIAQTVNSPSINTKKNWLYWLYEQ